MPKIDNFFSHQNTINDISEGISSLVFDYLKPIKAFARATNSCIYIIDYQKKGFNYVSDNPLFLCGHSAAEVKEMGYTFYFKYVPKK